jgi:sulfatase maturation enzyme AslB (radical SAM superfamily)
VVRAWGRILSGRYPSLSIEITRECPLRCPGCYAYDPQHLNGQGELRSLADFKSQELIDGVLRLVDLHSPLHLSIVGGEPLVRFRELSTLLPILSKRGISVQLVTSAVRTIPAEWAKIRNLNIVVSIDGLQPDHDIRRKPATYARILQNIKGHAITLHCTITSQMATREGYFREFVDFWSDNESVNRIWFSIFTPQIGADDPEILDAEDKAVVLRELGKLSKLYPKVFMPDSVIRAFREPPASPSDCIFSQTTVNYTADLKTRITPCQFGGDPDCSQCGCFASAGLKAVGDHKLLGLVRLKRLMSASSKIGSAFGPNV